MPGPIYPVGLPLQEIEELEWARHNLEVILGGLLVPGTGRPDDPPSDGQYHAKLNRVRESIDKVNRSVKDRMRAAGSFV